MGNLKSRSMRGRNPCWGRTMTRSRQDLWSVPVLPKARYRAINNRSLYTCSPAEMFTI